METRNIAVMAGDTVENVIVVEAGEAGEAFLSGEHGPKILVDAAGETARIDPVFLDVTDLPPGKCPGIGWRVEGELGAKMAEVFESSKKSGFSRTDAALSLGVKENGASKAQDLKVSFVAHLTDPGDEPTKE